MTTTTLTTYVAGGYTLGGGVTELIITSTGGVGGTGVASSSYATIDNSGFVRDSVSSIGVALKAGGTVINRLSGSIAEAKGRASTSPEGLGRSAILARSHRTRATV